MGKKMPRLRSGSRRKVRYRVPPSAGSPALGDQRDVERDLLRKGLDRAVVALAAVEGFETQRRSEGIVLDRARRLDPMAADRRAGAGLAADETPLIEKAEGPFDRSVVGFPALDRNVVALHHGHPAPAGAGQADRAGKLGAEALLGHPHAFPIDGSGSSGRAPGLGPYRRQSRRQSARPRTG